MADSEVQRIPENRPADSRTQPQTSTDLVPFGVVEVPEDSYIQGSEGAPPDRIEVEQDGYGGANWQTWRDVQGPPDDWENF